MTNEKDSADTVHARAALDDFWRRYPEPDLDTRALRDERVRLTTDYIMAKNRELHRRLAASDSGTPPA